MILAYYIEIKPTTALPPEDGFSPALQAHIARYQTEADRRRSLAAWRLLSYALGQAGWGGDLAPVFSRHGRPELSGGAPYISLAHSGNVAAAAVSDAPVGIDVEEVSERPVARLAGKCLCADELNRFAASDDPERCFYRHWTAKEACAKLLGTGLRGYPTDIVLYPDDTVSARRLPAAFREISDAQGVGYCLCVVGAEPAQPKRVGWEEILLQRESV